MKPPTLTRGAALAGAVTLLHASTALARSAGSTGAAPRTLAATGHGSASNPSAFERTPLHLGQTVVAHHASSGSMSGSIIRTIVGLAIVIAVIYGLTWIIRQAKAAKNPASGVGLEQVASLPLGTGRSVALVRVGSQLHLLGVAENSVTGIRTFTDDEAVELGLPVTAPGEDSAAGAGGATGRRAGRSSQLGRALNALRQATIR